MSNTTHPTDRPPGRRRFTVAAALLVSSIAVGTVGCKSTIDMSAFTRRNDDVERLANTDGVRGPLERTLAGRNMHRLGPMPGMDELEAAKRLYDDGEFRRAESAFKRVAGRYEETPVEEDALFYVAECKFHRGRYPGAQDQYNLLLKKYPSSRHLEASTRRLFDIGREWLGFPKPIESSEVAQVDFEKPSRTPAPGNPDAGWEKPALVPNLWNRKHPVFDSKGRGLESLRAIWLNDPTGPLADDALMLTASHHLREGNYQEADYLYSILREEYPNSPHLEKAFVLGSHVKLMSYQGSQYDGQSLAAARDLKESTLRLFPDTETRERIRGELDRIDEAKKDREWELVRYWQWKGNDRAVAMQCREVIRLFPNSAQADKARAVLAKLPPEASRLETPLRPPQQRSLLQRIPTPSLPRLLPVPSDDDEPEGDEWDDTLGEGDEIEDAIGDDRPRNVLPPSGDRPVDVVPAGGDRPVDAVGRARLF